MKYKLTAKSQYASFEQHFATKDEALACKCELEYNGWTLVHWSIDPVVDNTKVTYNVH